MKRIFIFALCIIAAIFAIYSYTTNSSKAEEVEVNGWNINCSSEELLDEMVGKFIKYEQKMSPQARSVEKTPNYPSFQVKACDKQGYDHHIEISILDSKASKEEATVKIQSYYEGLSKAEASDVNRAYLNELIGKGFEVKHFIMFASPDPNNAKAIIARAMACKL